MMKKMKQSEKATPRNTNKVYEVYIKKILLWYKTHGRHDLPWRKKVSPYAILVSEIMLQQTQVSRVEPKFALWMKQYPTLKALSHASLSDVLILWQGLGYQRRAKALLVIAQRVERLPKTYEELIALPGIGDYTASALMSFAYDKQSHMLETNIRTALIDAFHFDKEDITDGMLRDDLDHILATPSAKKVGARYLYLALMDYGAHLKANKISHNKKTKGYRTQTAYVGSNRKLRAEVLFAITKHEKLPTDERVPSILHTLHKEGFIQPSKKYEWVIA